MNPTEPAAIVPLASTVAAAAALCPVAGEPAVVRVVRALSGAPRLRPERVVVVAAAELAGDVTRALAAAGLTMVTVMTCPGPVTRWRCLDVGLDRVAAEDDSPILVGDHRNPLGSSAAATAVLDGLAAGHRVVVPVLPMTDTVKVADAAGAVVDTIDRQQLRTVQSPRGYTAAVLRAVAGVDDEFAAVLAAGVPVATVTGDADAFTADLPADAALLGAVNAARR
jgi:2-C-methyl-D-erythritol 4-phosphate cytidylyltransferase